MIVRYDTEYADKWDDFVLNKSINGSFLHTRRFLSYHKEGVFHDHSLLFFKGEELAAVLPANEYVEDHAIISHQGSTFGGIIIKDEFATITDYNWIFGELSEHLKNCNISHVEIRMPSWLYYRQDNHIELLDYYFQINGFSNRAEVGFCIDLSHLESDFEKSLATLRRRKLKKANANGLRFAELSKDTEIEEFYAVLSDNMKKFDTTPVHSLDSLLEFKNHRLSDIISFYGVYQQERMIAGSMVFNFNNKRVFHTQYLASRHDSLEVCPNEFLYVNLIKEALRLGYRFLSFGTSTLEHGMVFNETLALFKEGFLTETYINRSYIKDVGVE